ncbi:MAG: integrase arm-type DNA-binding domain-containing protein [Myxococcales bacterium]|jgi:integrase|nr:integrase arm-type DNA-binding domain-containing protein [Myxococcales bacterium]
MATRQRQRLSDVEIRSLKAQARPYNATDGDGLFLCVLPTGSKSWRFAFWYLGKRKTLVLGQYPEISLKRARELLAEARTHVAEGRDPCALKQAAKSARRLEVLETFEALSTQWLSEREPSWSASHAKGQARRLEKDLLPYLAGRPIKEIKAPELVATLRKLFERSGAEVTERAKQILYGVFRYAVNLGLLDTDPTTTLKGVTEAPQPTHFAAPAKDTVKVGGFLRMLEAPRLAGPLVQCALRLHPLVVVRPGELRCARWADIDFEAKEWRFVPSKTRKKNPEEHVVPLSRQAFAILEEVKPFSFGRSEWVFPSPRTMARPLSEAALNAALARAGIPNTELVPHGWRSVFRTLGAERCGFQWDCLEAQLAHAVPDVLGRAYNRAEWMEQRRVMMQRWADYLDELKAGVK